MLSIKFKKIFLSLLVITTLNACSGSTTIADSEPPPSDIFGIYRGTFENGLATDTGQVELNIGGTNTALTGTINFFESSDCLINGTIAGTLNAFSAQITVNQGNIATDLTIQFTATSNGNTLAGTYFSTQCSNNTGTGNISVTR